MANTYKDIVITPYRGDANNDPVIKFSTGDVSSNLDMNVRFYAISNGTLSFEGSAGQLFSVTNDLTGTLFSVNDISGIPSLEVDANGKITMAAFGGNVGIGTANATSKLHVVGNANITNDLYLSAGRNIYFDNSLAATTNGNDGSIIRWNGFLGFTTGLNQSASLLVGREANDVFVQRRGVNGQTSRIYGTFTDASNYERLSLSANANGSFIQTQHAGTGTARPLYIGANNATAVTIDTAGNVGIGTTAPTSKLEVAGEIRSNSSTVAQISGYRTTQTTTAGVDIGSLLFYNGSSSISSGILVSNNGNINNYKITFKTHATQPAFFTIDNTEALINNASLGLPSSSINFKTTGGNSLAGAIIFDGSRYIRQKDFWIDIVGNTIQVARFFADTSEIMRITGSGNVGIGTTNPTSKLHVVGNANITGDVVFGGNVTLGDASTDTITINGSTISLGNNQSFDSGTLFIDATNNRVGINTTSLSTSVQSGLEIRKTGAGWYHNSISHGGLYSEFTSSTGPMFTIRTDNGSPQLRLQTSGNSIVMLPGSGNVGIGTTTPTSNLHVIGTANITSSLTVANVNIVPAISEAFNRANTGLFNAREINTNDTLTLNDYQVFANGNISITLISAAGNVGKQYTVTNISNNQVTLLAQGSDTIIGYSNMILEQRWSSLTLTSTGTTWVIS
jgi:hypothetical protein